MAGDYLVVEYADTVFRQIPIRHLHVTRFKAVPGFLTWRGLGHLKTLHLNNSRADEQVIRELLTCDGLSESAMLWCGFGVMFVRELRAKFGTRLMSPRPLPNRLG